MLFKRSRQNTRSINITSFFILSDINIIKIFMLIDKDISVLLFIDNFKTYIFRYLFMSI